MGKLVSIIIPVYNAEEFLSKCLDSILSQVYSNIEVLLIDDGSKDKSLGICNSYAKKDNRIKVLHQENLGAAAARNIGLEHITGDYVMFCDSDDVVSENWVKHLIDANSDCVMPVCSSCNVVEHLGKKTDISIQNDTLYSKNDYYKFNEVGLAGFLWNTIFNASYIEDKHIRFRDQIDKADYNEDLLFVMEYIKSVDYFVYVGYADYAYITRDNSLSRKYNPYYFDKYAEKFEIWQKFNNMFGDNSKLIKISTTYLYHFLISLQDEIKNKNCSKKNRYKRFKKIVVSNSFQKCVNTADTSAENAKVIEMIKKKACFRLWIYLNISIIKNKVLMKEFKEF